MAACGSSSENTGKTSLIPVFNKKFTMGSYRVGIGHAWCSWKASEICSLLIQKKKMKKMIFLHTSCPNSNRPVFGLKFTNYQTWNLSQEIMFSNLANRPCNKSKPYNLCKFIGKVHFYFFTLLNDSYPFIPPSMSILNNNDF
jgi:hypothetical protein